MQFSFLLCLLAVPTILSFELKRPAYGSPLDKLFSSRFHIGKRSQSRFVSKRGIFDGSSSQGFLKIQKAPPLRLEARQHGKTTLECSASGNPAPRITWFKDGKPLIKELTEGDYGEFSIESLSETKSVINLDCISESDAGLYECVAHTDQKEAKVGTEVQVVSFEPNGCVPRNLMNFEASKPIIFQWMETYMQILGLEAHLVCRSEGHETVHWYGPDGEMVDENNKKFVIKANGDLLIKDLNFGDMGMYRCMAKNSIGEDMKETFLYPLAPESSNTA
ncbi:zwei Ig domain protein zig-4 isoform X2 [Lepeophtheirus salmonis]|uniref:zwei Ig domain protein zig-4 isoform X2 n=1 Tax=Lepeophtheirus salmonis TaxID=72036 RepID=UPI003AF38833